MKLYTFGVAPNPTKVGLYLAEKREGGTEIDLDETTLHLGKGEQKTPEHLARNPFGSLPVLEIGDGDFIIESLTIIDYLEELHPEPPMWGADPRSRAAARQIERIVETRVLSPMGRYVHATKSPLGLPPNPEVAKASLETLEVGLVYVDRLLSDDRPLLVGNRVTVADCSLQAGLQLMRFSEMELIAEHEAILRWDAAYRERPAAKAVLLC